MTGCGVYGLKIALRLASVRKSSLWCVDKTVPDRVNNALAIDKLVDVFGNTHNHFSGDVENQALFLVKTASAEYDR